MKIRVKKTKLETNNPEDIDWSKYLEIDQEYIVLGISLNLKNGNIYFEIYLNLQIISCPVKLFDIIDNRLSKYWDFRISSGMVLVWPQLFYEEYFFDQFGDFDEDYRNRYEKLKKQMLDEFNYSDKDMD